MILDANGQPFTEKSIGQQYCEALERSRRDTRFNLVCSHHAGWSHEQFRHWVDTGEEPKTPGNYK